MGQMMSLLISRTFKRLHLRGFGSSWDGATSSTRLSTKHANFWRSDRKVLRLIHIYIQADAFGRRDYFYILRDREFIFSGLVGLGVGQVIG